MVDNFQAIGSPGIIGPQGPSKQSSAAEVTGDKDFKSVLMDSINEVNRLQNEADEARINLVTGKSDNVAEVFTAVKKAELAFQTLMQIRNKLESAYEEIKQMRV